MSKFSALNTQKAAYLLGLGGLIPFVAGAYGAWTFDANHAPFAVKALINYAALIVSFLGALYWGRSLSAPQETQNSALWLIWSVTPFLAAWPLMMAPPLYALGGFIIVLFCCLALDYLAYRRHIMPRWMMPLRLILTLSASLCLGSALWATWHRHESFMATHQSLGL